MSILLATLPIALSSVGLFLSLWIVLPAVNAAVLPLTVGTPEISPWLIVGNVVAIAVSASVRTYPLWKGSVAIALLALGLSSLPLLQLPFVVRHTSANFQQTLGVNVDADFRDRPLPVRHHPFSLADALRGIPTSAVIHDPAIPFANPEGVRLTLDIYRPAHASGLASPNPTLVAIYGGAWQRGSSENNSEFNRYMASRGYTVVAMNYRHAPQFRFPAQLDDVQAALAWICDRAEQYDIDRDRLAVVGRSAGAQLAMLLGYSPESKIRAVVNFYGPVNLANGYRFPPTPDPIATRPTLEAFLGGTPDEFPDLYRQASPISYVRENLPPSLLIYGGRDLVVQAKYGRVLAEKLADTGNTAVWVEIPWADHVFDTVFNGVSSQLSLYYIERFLAWTLHS